MTFLGPKPAVERDWSGHSEWCQARIAEIAADRQRLLARVAALKDGGPPNGDLSDRDLRRVERLVGQIDELDDEKSKLEAELRPGPSAGRRTLPEDGTIQRLSARGDNSIHATSGRRTFAALFGQATARDADGWSSPDEFLRVIHSGLHDERLRIAAQNTEGTGADGGFLVPTQLVGRLLDMSLESEVVRPRAMVLPMTSNHLSAPGLDAEDHSGGSIGGLLAQWLAEAGAGTRQKAKFRNVNLTAKKLAIFAQASSELEQDGVGFAQQLAETMARSIGFGLDSAFLFGGGVGKPLGILVSPALITVAKETSQIADSLVYANVRKMAARLHPASWNNAVWVISPSVLTELLSLFVVGRTDTGAPMTNAGSLVMTLGADGMYRLLGRPVVVSEKMKQLGDAGDILLADLSYYLIGLRKEASLQRAIEPGWTQDLVDYRMIVRVDGAPKLDTPITPANGGDTLSPFVSLAERA